MKKTTQTVKLVFMAAVLSAAGTLSKVQGSEPGEDNPHLWKPTVKSVAVFKNGLGFFLREGKVDLREGWCVTSEVPPAAFGTLAIYSVDENHLVDIVGSGPGEIVDFDGRDAPKDSAYKRGRLESSKGLRVELTYSQKGTDRRAAGKIVSVGPDFVVLENQEHSFAVPVEGITRMQILDLPVRVHVEAEAGETPQKTTLGMAYLRKGVTWIPEYTVKVLDDTTAELTLRGSLVNEAEDLIHCDVHFVVGVPHFLHTDYMAPIAVGQAIRTIGAAVAPQIQAQLMQRAAIVSNNDARADQFGGGVYDVVERPVGDGGRDVSRLLGNLPRMEGAAATDYTVYTKKDMSLRRGEKAIVTLFVKKISYSHVYRWAPPEKMKHFLVLHNGTDTAWTTGPYLALSEGRPLSEDLLKYTPMGGNCEIPITQAINISHDKSESEIDRKLKAHEPRPDRFLDLVTIEGRLRVRNFEKESVRIIIEVSAPGKPISASEDGAIQADPSKLTLTERQGTVRWEIKLKKDEAKELTYKYERYVSSG
ncbi:MAG TPA: hypothetical protein VMX13_06275 [Sedimentisphaerales bacterium]|nr:hypothetical protein [Sedimentisphaerales bacterium]